MCPDTLAHAIQQEAKKRCYHMLEGVDAYQRLELEIEESPYDVIWQKGNARLLDYGEGNGPAVLCVPSLINRHYILDLYPQRSLVAHLNAQGFRPLVIDWSEPGLQEKYYDLAEYVYEVLRPALRHLYHETGEPVHLMGYCMGGVLALAATVLTPNMVASLSLLATPWDFSAQSGALKSLPQELLASVQTYIQQQDTVPAWWVQAAFHAASPWHFQEKFSRFSSLGKAEQQHFAAVESWANDGVPLARGVGKECFLMWPKENPLQQGKWRIAGRTIIPEKVNCPVFMAVPSEDKIVPAASSQPLANALPHARIIRPSSGHVSMVVGKAARKTLWQPWTGWLAQHS